MNSKSCLVCANPTLFSKFLAIKKSLSSPKRNPTTLVSTVATVLKWMTTSIKVTLWTVMSRGSSRIWWSSIAPKITLAPLARALLWRLNALTKDYWEGNYHLPRFSKISNPALLPLTKLSCSKILFKVLSINNEIDSVQNQSKNRHWCNYDA